MENKVKTNEELERIIGLENEVNENLIQIDDLHRFIENVCDTEEDIHEPYNKINELMEENEELNDEITEFYYIWSNNK
tara:strand:+ start:3918 stop:4151 length:234 start_codon:yes stop_codon:yes gene_type:complete